MISDNQLKALDSAPEDFKPLTAFWVMMANYLVAPAPSWGK